MSKQKTPDTDPGLLAGNVAPLAEIKPGGTAKATTRKPTSKHIQLVAKLDRILAAEDADTARWCLVFLAGQYGILTDHSLTDLARRSNNGAIL